MERLAVPPELFRWARKRAGLSPEQLMVRWPRYSQWETGEAAPTERQLEELARRTRVPLGFFFLPWAPSEDLEVADFRAAGARRAPVPSMELLETVHLCRLRQHWYHEWAIQQRRKPLRLIGSQTPAEGVVSVADSIRSTLDLRPRHCEDAKDATRVLEAAVDQIEGAGIMVMRGGATPETNGAGVAEPEFRGLALSDPLAPLIYLDTTDTPASQLFTLAHELAHLWLGTSGISNPHETLVAGSRVLESFTNRVAAETLVPLETFRDAWNASEDLEHACDRLAREFCTSSLIILRRAYDAGFLAGEQFHSAYQSASERLSRLSRLNGVTGMPLTPLRRVGKRFGDALAAALQARQVSEHEAMGLLGALTAEEVWMIGGGHDECLAAEAPGGGAPCYAHLVRT